MNIQQKKLFALLLLCLFFITCTYSQGFTSSPYSLYGIGSIEDKGFCENLGMGSVGIALPSETHLNPVNPASYSFLDSVSFFYNVGLMGKLSDFSSQGESQKGIGANLNYLSIGFKANKRWGMSLGVKPFSSRGYRIITDNDVEGSLDTYKSMIAGSGSINQFYFTNSFKIAGNLSLGINSSFLFGNLGQDEKIIYTEAGFNNISINSTNYFSSLYFDFGLQYHLKRGSHRLSSGIVFSPVQDLTTVSEKTIKHNFSNLDEDLSGEEKFTIPYSLGMGLAYTYSDRLKLASDFTLQSWSQNDYSYKSANLDDSWQVNAGVEFTPKKARAGARHKPVDYRLGFKHKQTYLELRGHNLEEDVVSLGVGIPIRNRRSGINIGIEYGVQGTTENRLIKEEFVRFTVGFSLRDTWFVRSKFD